MAIFIDSSDPKEIKELFSWGVLSGVTTNPLIIAKEAPDADLVVNDRGISRRHLSLEALPDGVLLRDLGSRNGTWLGDCSISLAKLTADVIGRGPEQRWRLGADDRR